MKLVLDSSVFISYLNENDVFYEVTTQFIEYLLNKKPVVIMPVIVFLEVANVLSRQHRNFTENIMLSMFQTYDVLDINLDFARKLLPLFKRVNLKTSDAIILGTAILNNATLVTWDEKLVKQAKTLANVQTPKTFLNKATT